MRNSYILAKDCSVEGVVAWTVVYSLYRAWKMLKWVVKICDLDWSGMLICISVVDNLRHGD